MTVLRAWPDPRAWLRTVGQPWRGCRLGEPILWRIGAATHPRFVQRAMLRARALEGGGDDDDDDTLARLRAGLTLRSQAARAFLALFPESVLARAGALPERHWHLVTLLARVPGAAEFADGNLALAHALASSWAFRPRPDAQPYRSARRVVGLRRSQIAEWLGFQGRPAVVRVLGKVRPGAVSVRRLLHLRQTLGSGPIPKALLHLPSLDRCVLRIVTDPQLFSRVTPRFLEDVSHDPTEAGLERLAYMLDDTLRMAGELEVRLGPMRSVKELRHVHDELAEGLNRSASEELASVVLPPPPVAGTDEIVPLVSAEQILAEGREMHHCVASYIRPVAAGQVYVYRLLAPERATLSLRSDRDGWELAQIKGPANAPVEHETVQQVHAWLARMRQLTSHAGCSHGEWQRDQIRGRL
ncbi:MAG: PcfJ domain-containing protein [Myxococcales bacterium]|nr:PcfJ domain-containing protein [Myxococcales bacterium]